MSSPRMLWAPAPERASATQLYQFLHDIASRYGVFPEWESLRAWSVAQRASFWSELVRFAQIEFSTPPEETVSGDGTMLGTKWFDGARLNYARHMLRFDDDGAAIVFESELHPTRTLSHLALRYEVTRFAAALRAEGVTSGDRVAGYMPNIPETLIAMLATASIGAIWSSCSPDFGVSAVVDRFGQIEPVVLVVADGYCYGGRVFGLHERVTEIAAQLPSLRRIIVTPYLREVAENTSGLTDPAKLSGRGKSWRDFVSTVPANQPLIFEEVPFDHPLFVMYSSGTTGVPKCIVHGHGGVLLQHMKELMLHTDLRRGERIFYYTTCGWMMWNWLVSALGVGATVVLYDGNPAHPDTHRLWDLAARLGIHVFGISPKYLSAVQKSHVRPGEAHNLAALRCICSTGSPLAAEQFDWVYDAVKADLQLSSISGGTDIISCFMLGNPILPVYAGEIQCRGLAMDVHAWDENGRSVIGQKGELVCTSAFPSQPVGFWNDPTGAKYRSAYFEHFSGIWRHGDFIEITPRGGVIVYGRSDATLNPGGVRIGTAEIYRCVETLPEVLDSICCARRSPDEGDEQIALFVVLRSEVTLDSDLRERIRTAIANGASKRHVPRFIRQAPAIPYTISGKKVELAVQQALHGEPVLNRDALANPEALDFFRTVT